MAVSLGSADSGPPEDRLELKPGYFPPFIGEGETRVVFHSRGDSFHWNGPVPLIDRAVPVQDDGVADACGPGLVQHRDLDRGHQEHVCHARSRAGRDVAPDCRPSTKCTRAQHQFAVLGKRVRETIRIQIVPVYDVVCQEALAGDDDGAGAFRIELGNGT